MKIAITGHRPNKLGNDYDLTSPLIRQIRYKILEELEEQKRILIKLNKGEKLTLITGMALGIDTLFAQIAIEFKIPFIAAIPCRGQTMRWPITSITKHSEIISNSLCTVHYVSDKLYTPDCMQKRNQWMVDNCDILIAVWDGTLGGTANCVKYAVEMKREIIRINPQEIKQLS